MIPSVTAVACYLAIIYGDPSLGNNINGIIAPIVTVFLLAYFVSCMFNELFGMAIETILLCYVADEEMFKPADRYADGPLQEAVSKTAAGAASAKVHIDEKDSAAQDNFVKPFNESPPVQNTGGGELML